MARSGWINTDFIDIGPFGLELLKPYALFGLEGLGSLHACGVLRHAGSISADWLYGSLPGRPDPIEQVQGSQFVDIFKAERHDGGFPALAGGVETRICTDLLGPASSARNAPAEAFDRYAVDHGGYPLQAGFPADPLHERLLAGAIGAASPG